MTNKIRTLIVDDELDAREGLESLLRTEDNIELIPSCQNGFEAVNTLTESSIDLMILDVQMPGMNGFEVINLVNSQRMPVVIFCTAYDEFAVQAFEVKAVDYLLKPFSDARFKEALNRAVESIELKNQSSSNKLIREISESYETKQGLAVDFGKVPGKLTVKEGGNLHFVDHNEIIWVEAYDYYIRIHSTSKSFVVRESMKSIVTRLPVPLFRRIHNSSIINTKHLSSVIKRDGVLEVVLSNRHKLTASRKYRDSLEDLS